MKTSEMNTRQKRAFFNIKYAAYWHIGGLENTLQDYAEDSDEYKAAKAELADHDGLVATIYQMATTDIYAEGACYFGNAPASYLRDIRFCGKEWLMERVEARVRKEGY